MEVELEHKFVRGAKIMRRLARVCRNRGMTIDVKMGILGSIVVPKALYESE